MNPWAVDNLHAQFSARLREAIAVGMVEIDDQHMQARVLAPPRVESLTDDDWLNIIAAGSEMQRELKALGYNTK